MTLTPSLDAFRLLLRVADPFGCGWRRGIQHLRRRIARHHHPPIRYSSRRGAAVPLLYGSCPSPRERVVNGRHHFLDVALSTDDFRLSRLLQVVSNVVDFRLTPAEGARQQFLVSAHH